MKILTSNTFQNLCKWASKPNVNRNINLYTPVVQSAFVSSFYIYDIYKSDMPEKNKRNMLIHDYLTAGIGILSSVGLNKGIDKFKNNVIKHLSDKNNIDKLGAVTRGVKILFPVAITSGIMRLGLPVGSIYVADFIDKYIKKDKKNV